MAPVALAGGRVRIGVKIMQHRGQARWLVVAAGALALSGCMMMPGGYDEGYGYGYRDDGYGRHGSAEGDWRYGRNRAGWNAGPVEAYDPIDRADMLARMFGNAEPDFGFPFDGGYAYAWRTRTGEMMIIEPRRNEVLQFFYDAGAMAPYLVRDADGAFAFDGNVAVARYASSGLLRGWQGQGFDPGEATAAWERGRTLLAAAQSTHWRGSRNRVPDWSTWMPVVGSIFIGNSYGWGDPYWRSRNDWYYGRRRDRYRPPVAQQPRQPTQAELEAGRRSSAPMWTAPADRSQAVPLRRDAPAAARSPDGGRWRDGIVESSGRDTIAPPPRQSVERPQASAPTRAEPVETPAPVHDVVRESAPRVSERPQPRSRDINAADVRPE